MMDQPAFSLKKERRDARTRLRLAVVEAAAKILATGGGKALTVRDLAQSIGASTKVIYSHFGGMPGVIAAVYADAFSLLTKSLQQADKTEAPINERLAAVALAYRNFAIREPHLFELMYGQPIRELAPTKKHRDDAAASLLVIVGIYEAQGHSTASAREKAYAFWAIIHGSVALEATGWAAERADAMFETSLAAARASI